MGWDWLIGQQRVADTLRRAVAAERVAHAYLFHGPDGTGKRAAALALAQTLQCERRAPGESSPCGACPACSKVARMIHPDLHVYLPYPKKKTTSAEPPDDYGDRVRQLADDPYAVVDYVRRPSLDDPEKTSNKQVAYPVGEVREGGMRQHMQDLRLTPAEGKVKFALFLDADRMREEAANAFLKLLEEPTPRTVIVLTTTRPDRMLPTILSRCQRVRFDPLTPEAIEQALVARQALPAERAALLARMADGSYTRACTLAESEDLARQRAHVLAFFRAAYVGDEAGLDDLIADLAGLGREGLKGTLGLMLRWVRDLVLYRHAGADAEIVNVDQRATVERFVGNVPDARLDALASLVEHAVELVERNVNTTLVLTVLADALRAAMGGQDRRRLFAPLADPIYG